MPVLRVEIQPPVAWVVLERPDEGNPIDDELVPSAGLRPRSEQLLHEIAHRVRSS